MKRWAWAVAALYIAVLAVLAVPGIMAAFAPDTKATEAVFALLWPPCWLWLVLMFLAQMFLLAVPVRVAGLRPVSRGPVWRTVLAGGFMAGALVAGALLSLSECWMRTAEIARWNFWLVIFLSLLAWGSWTVVFLRDSRVNGPENVAGRQCRSLLKGSVLELLIAVPTHIVARHRHLCCAGYLTFLGLTIGVSVMLFAFGPAVFFLFAERWKRLHPPGNLS